MSAFDPSRPKATGPFGEFLAAAPNTPSLEDLLRRLLPTDPSALGAPGPPAETPSSELLKGAYGPYEPEVPVYPPIRGFGYRIPIIPAPEEPVPSLSKPPGVPGQPLSRAPDFLDALADVWNSGVLPEMPVRPSAAAVTKAAMSQSREIAAPSRTEGRSLAPMSVVEKDGETGKSSPTIFDAGPPTDQPADEFTMYGLLGFDPGGPSHFAVGTRHLFNADVILGAKDETMEAVKRHFGPDTVPQNNPADAFKHALWSYKITKEKGAAFAKEVTDSLEVGRPAPPGDRIMDLYNNNIGRQLAMDPQNGNRNDEEVVLEALNRGKLQTHYFQVLPVRGQLQTPPLLLPYGYRGGQ